MRNVLRKILQKKLRFFARAVLKKYSPDVVAVTGSVGKTMTKDAIYAVLSSTYDVRKNQKNFNNEIGVPLTILGVKSPVESYAGWFRIFLHSFFLLFGKKKYPQILVLEMGADKPGDIRYLTSLAKPKVSVVTSVSPAHIEFFENIETIAEEKSFLVKNVYKNGAAVLNVDDENVYAMRDLTKAEKIFYGFGEIASVRAIASENIFTKSKKGIELTVQSDSRLVSVFIPNTLGKHTAYSLLAAFSVGEYFDLTLPEIAKSLENFQTPAGRMKVLPGIKNTTIIDDSYNSSPLALQRALETFREIFVEEPKKKYAVLGDMLELGSKSGEEHRKAGRLVFLNNIDVLITVGELAREIAHGAREAGLGGENIFSFSNSSEAGIFVQERIEEGDVILVKGSQAIRTEKIVKEIMAEPLKAEQLLVRQYGKWLKS